MKVVRREFWKNVLPSMIAFAFTGVYAIVDGFFVGRNVGDAGLAAINMAYPLVALIQAAGSGLGMAGAIQIAINKGKKDKQEERRYLGNAIILLAVAGIVLMAGLSLAHIRILEMFGAQERSCPMPAFTSRLLPQGLCSRYSVQAWSR